MHFEYQVEGGDFTNAGTTSSKVKKMMKQLGVDPAIVKRTVVALYEAEVNIVAHAYRGTIYVDLEDTSVSIRLEDEGPGIPKEDGERMFEMFTKVNDLSEGLGLGLALTRRHIRNLGGDVFIDETYDNGCRMIIELPKIK